MATLSDALQSGSYRPDPLTPATIEVDGRTRDIHLPSVRDRVVERSVLDSVTAVIDPLLGPFCFGYRPGLGVPDAVHALRELRDEGHSHVLRADVDDCFASIPVLLALSTFSEHIHEEPILAVVRALLGRLTKDRRGRVRSHPGLPLGCALSPLLTNLVLSRLDSTLAEEGFPIIRYADDFVVAAHSFEEASCAQRLAAETLAELEMRMGEDKTEITTYQDGFTFLGEDFGLRYPRAATETVRPPDRRVLYIGSQGSRVRKARGRVIVESKDEVELVNVAQTKVARIVCFGSVGLSAGVREWALRSGVEVYLATRRGSYLGQMVASSRSPRVERIQAQLRFSETDECLELARRVVAAKLSKQAVLVKRFGRRTHRDVSQEAIVRIRAAMEALPTCATRDELMGNEGAAARAYFQALGRMAPESLRFERRSRRPPEDVFNAALSWGYALLLGECETALIAAGLDPAIGVLHAVEGQRPSLALDLMEEFRVLIVDQCVMQAARSGALTAEHGRSEPGKPGVLLDKAGRAAVIDAYERRMLDKTAGALPTYSGTLRRHLYRQAQRLSSSIQHGEPTWTGLSWR
ncbi:MAG: CRISPR-associated endonuclease Cas1 [Aeromicrobium sp.]|uniref:CRISPR-associated endonuclease Cas1 n=1 Tax=Aeromicrobium sp. TaxID=1871063 RepID=UPI0039E2E028